MRGAGVIWLLLFCCLWYSACWAQSRQIGSTLGIPAKYYDQMRAKKPELLAENVNAWFADRDQRYMVRTMDYGNGRVARALLSDRYRRIDNMEIAAAVLPLFAGKEEMEVVSCEVTPSKLYLKILNRRLEMQVVPGDYVQAGVVISNSEVGLGAVSVQPLVYRLVCTNGMVVNDFGERKAHVGRSAKALEDSFNIYTDETREAEDRAFLLALRDTTLAAIEEARFAQIVGKLRESTDAKITGRVQDVIELTGKNYDLNTSEQDSILNYLIAGGDLSLYGLSNKVNFVNIPQELKKNASFCVWKLEKRQGKPTKVPYNPKTGQMAKTNDPATFATFADAMKAYAMGGYDGIGYRVSEGIGAIDIDHCIREDGSLNDVAASILGFFPDTYFERSPSGTGLRGFFRLSPDFAYDKTVYYINNRKHGLEVYLPGTTNRFVTVTGDVYRNGYVGRNDAALQSTLDTFMKRKSASKSGFKGTPVSYFTDEQVIEHASNSASGEKFKDLYDGNWSDYFDSQSDADMALVSILTFWCGCVEEQIDRIFRSSGLMRDKWDRRTGDSTYGQITIRNAVLSASEIYRPVRTEDNTHGAEDDFQNLDINTIQEERDRREREGYSFTPDLRCLDTTIEALAPHTNPRYESFQIGNARMFVDYYRKIILMNETRNCWYIYDGRVWRPDTHGLRISEMAIEFHNVLANFANSITSEDTRERFLKRVDCLDQKKFRDIMVKDSSNDKSISVKMDAFDRDKYTFNCHNGTINLKTGEFRPHSPEDRLTKMTEVDYDPEATCPRWLTFLDEVFEGDKDRIRYLQKAVGYAMSGDTRLECMYILYGPTSRNGKGTTMETVLRILGEYGRTAKPEMLSKKGFADSSGPSEDVARLNGARMVNVSEPEKSMVIDASLTKQMTGNNTITARFLRENSFEFKPQFKLFIDTNHRPVISDMTLFESDRIRIIPFNRHFTEEERDIDLKSFFAEPANLSGILNWCLEGFRLYQEEGLKMPESVKKATDDYREQSDRISMFTKQCLVKKKGEELRSSAVYTRYLVCCRISLYFFWTFRLSSFLYFLWPGILENTKKKRNEIAQKEQNIKNTDAAEIGGI